MNANDIDVPDVMVESEIDNMMSEFDQQLRSQGMDLEGYFKYLGTEPKDFRDESERRSTQEGQDKNDHQRCSGSGKLRSYRC